MASQAFINPYSHTSFVQNPTLGRKLYADEVHDDLHGMSNQFTATPTINKYARSVESTIDLHQLPPMREIDGSIGIRTAQGTTDNSDIETINKRLLSTDSIYELKAIPCPFRGGRESESANRKKRRAFSEESRYDLDNIPDPFGLTQERHRSSTPASPLPMRSDYVYGVGPSRNTPSHYAFDHTDNWSSHSPDYRFTSPRSDRHSYSPQHPHYTLPNSSYDYTAYSQPTRYVPTHSDYDYTPYAQPYMQPAYVYPQYHMAPMPPPAQMHPHAYRHPYHYPPEWYQYPPAPMHPMAPPHPASPYGHHHRMPPMQPGYYPEPGGRSSSQHRFASGNEPHDSNVHGPYSMSDISNVGFDQDRFTSSSSSGNQDPYQLRDFSVESIREINALPPLSALPMYHTPSKNVYTAKSISGEVSFSSKIC